MKQQTLGYVLVAALALAGCDSEIAEPEAPSQTAESSAPAEAGAAPEPAGPAPADAAYAFARDDDVVQIELTTPEATLRRDAELHASVYGASLEEAEAFAEQAAQAKAELEGENFEYRPYSLAINWHARFETGRVASLVKNHWEYTGGAHGNYHYESLFWDFETSEPVAIAGLFNDTPETWETMSALAREALIAAKRERIGDADAAMDGFWDEAVEQVTAPEPASFEVFTLVPSDQPGQAGGLKLYYPPYAVGPYAEGGYETVIAQADFNSLLDPSYAGLFGGAPVPGEDASP